MHLLKKSLLPWTFIVVLFLSFTTTPVALAFDGRSGDEVIIGADETIEDDLYVGANRLVINGTVTGDVFAGATQIEVNGTVEGDLVIGAQSLVINGTVGDDVRAGVAVMTIGETGRIGDDLLIGGYSLEAKAGSTIGGDIQGGTGQSTLNGTVEGNVAIGAGGLVINGAVTGNVTAEVGAPGQAPPFNPFVFMPNAPAVTPVAPGLVIGPDATIGGDLNYRTGGEVTVPNGVVGGTVNFTRVAQPQPEPPLATATLQRRGIRAVQYWIALLVLGLLLIAIARRVMRGSADSLGATPGQSFVWGLAALILFPIAFLLLIGIVIALSIGLNTVGWGELASMLLLTTIPASLILLLLYLLTLVLITKVTVSYQLGRFITRSEENIFWSLLLGSLLVAFFVWLPFVGSALSLIITLFGLGALWLWWRSPATPPVKQDPYALSE